jgi:metallo-beta-lactamase class B
MSRYSGKKVMPSKLITTLAVICAMMVLPPTLAAQETPLEFPTDKQFAESRRAQEHVTRAMALAGQDLVAEAKAFCTPTGPQRAPALREAAGLPPVRNQPVEPMRIFDNLYYMGLDEIGAFAIPTSDGIILFDALSNATEARELLVAGLRKVGLDPAGIKYLIIGHGHNDHSGGAAYLQDTYKPRVLMSDLDWALTEKMQRPDRPQPKRDMTITDGQQITLGDTTATLMHMRGHTPGTIAMFLPAKYQGKTHGVLIFGGTRISSRPSLAASRRVFESAKKQNAETALFGHTAVLMNTVPLMASVSTSYPPARHPFLYGPERFGRYLDIVLECAEARIAAVETDAR